MSHTPANAELDSRFKAAYNLVNGSLGNKDIAQLDEGYKLMRDTASLCMGMGKLEMMADGIRHVRSCVTYKSLVESYKAKNTPEAFFDRVLYYFAPYQNEIGRIEKSTIDIDEKLIKSFVRLDSTSDYSSLLREYGLCGSRKAFAIALEESFKIHAAHQLAGSQPKFNISLLSAIEAYTPAPTAKACLPEEVLSILQRRPLQLLALHQEDRHHRQKGVLKLAVLEVLFKRAAADEVMTDVLLEIASHSAFKLVEHDHLVRIEELTGTVIDHKVLRGELNSYSKEDDEKIAMLYYVLCSRHFPADEVSSALRTAAYWNSPAVHLEAMRLAIQAQHSLSDEFDNKVATYIDVMQKHAHATAIQLLDLPGVPRRRVLEIPALRDLLLAGDLGL